MPFRSYHGFQPYVPVTQRRQKAHRAAKKLAGKGRALSPIVIAGRAIANTFWGQAWCRNLESYSDYENRLPRGRTYVRNGSVIDLQIAAGEVTALVQGSSLYTVKIRIAPLAPKRWRAFKEHCAGRVTNLLDLLQGRLSKEVLADITAHGTGLFPAPSEIKLDCSCPDWADMCKHVAAVLYGVGARLDHEPALFFTVRGVDMEELIAAASTAATSDLAGAPSGDTALANADLADIFGVEIDTGTMPPAPPASATAVVTAGPPVTAPRRGKPKAKAKAKEPGPVARRPRSASRIPQASGSEPPPKPAARRKTAKPAERGRRT